MARIRIAANSRDAALRAQQRALQKAMAAANEVEAAPAPAPVAAEAEAVDSDAE